MGGGGKIKSRIIALFPLACQWFFRIFFGGFCRAGARIPLAREVADICISLARNTNSAMTVVIMQSILGAIRFRCNHPRCNPFSDNLLKLCGGGSFRSGV